jgi:hypothetical protein
MTILGGFGVLDLVWFDEDFHGTVLSDGSQANWVQRLGLRRIEEDPCQMQVGHVEYSGRIGTARGPGRDSFQ